MSNDIILELLFVSMGASAISTQLIQKIKSLFNLGKVFNNIFSMFSYYRIIIFTACFATISLSYFISTLIDDKIGGMTGDTCGFITEISQITFMIFLLFLQG